MAISKNKSNISNNNSKDKLEQKDCGNSSCKCQEDKSKSGFNWLAFWAFTIPAYTYFFGYNAKSYYLDFLGFDVAEASSDPGEVYHFAFNSLLFINYKSYQNVIPFYKSGLLGNGIYYLCMTIAVVVVSYLTFKYVQKRNAEASNDDDSKSSKPKEKKKPIPAWLASAYVGIGYILTNILAAPLIVLILTVIAIFFSPAPIVGFALAKYHKENFECEFVTKNPTDIPSCTKLILNDGSIKTGDIVHKDAQYIHLYTAKGPVSLSLNEVKSIERFRVESEQK